MKGDTVYLRHMLMAIEEIENFTGEGSDLKTLRAVERDIEIIGEAARNLSQALKSGYPEVPWQDIVGMRHKLSHDYFGVDAKIVWDTVRCDLPPLKAQIARILKRLQTA